MVVNSNFKLKDNNFLLVISSKNKKSLSNFLFFFFQHIKTKKHLVKISLQKNSLQRLTLLKSPHVNKIAQEQFESKEFAIKILVKSGCVKLFIVIFKNLLNTLFQDLKITIKIKQKVSNRVISQIFNFFNYKFVKNNKKIYFNKTLKISMIKVKNKYLWVNYQKINKLTKLLKLISLNGEFLTSTR